MKKFIVLVLGASVILSACGGGGAGGGNNVQPHGLTAFVDPGTGINFIDHPQPDIYASKDDIINIYKSTQQCVINVYKQQHPNAPLPAASDLAGPQLVWGDFSIVWGDYDPTGSWGYAYGLTPTYGLPTIIVNTNIDGRNYYSDTQTLQHEYVHHTLFEIQQWQLATQPGVLVLVGWEDVWVTEQPRQIGNYTYSFEPTGPYFDACGQGVTTCNGQACSPG